MLHGVVAYVGEHNDARELARRFLEQMGKDSLCPADSINEALQNVTDAALSKEVKE